jgi:hypothetical protein
MFAMACIVVLPRAQKAISARLHHRGGFSQTKNPRQFARVFDFNSKT